MFHLLYKRHWDKISGLGQCARVRWEYREVSFKGPI